MTPASLYHIFRRRLSTLVTAVLGVALFTPTTAPAAPLAALLAAVAFNDRFPVPARADVRIERREGDDVHTAQGVLLGRGNVVYVEVEGGTRALVRPGKIVVAGPHGPRRAEPGAAIAGTDLLLEDLTPFTAARLAVPQISDEGPSGVVVTGAPTKPSAYVLVVLTIEDERGTIARTQYYADAISELAKIRHDRGFAQIDGHWRPTEITVDRLREKTSTRLTLTWTPVPTIDAARFAPAALHGAGLLGGERH